MHVPRLKTCISNSLDILGFLYGRFLREERAEFLKPVDSKDKQLEERFSSFGGHVRRWLYYYALTDARESTPKAHELTLRGWGLYQPGVQLWQKIALFVLHPVLRQFVRTMLRVNQTGYQKAVLEIEDTLRTVEELLSDGREYILDTKVPTYLDLQFASMGALLVFPEEYSGGRVVEKSKLKAEHLPEQTQREIEAYRKRPAGQFVLRMYQKHRYSKARKSKSE